MWKILCVPYFKEMGLTIGKPGRSEDDRQYVRHLCKRILAETEHGNERSKNPMIELAGEVKEALK